MQNFKSNRILLFASAFIIVALFLFAFFRDNADSITLKEAQNILQNHLVKEVLVNEKYVYLKTDNNFYKIASSQVRPKMFIDYKVKVDSGVYVLTYILFSIIFLGIGSLLFRWWQKRGFKLTKDKTITSAISANQQAQNINSPIAPIKSDVTFDDIGGISEVKVELEEIIDFMKNQARYKKFGARMPKGVLLVGPPGVGKTMIAKAVASSAGVPFYYQSGASFVQIYVGMGAKRVHELFATAKKNAPSIIFIDEIDAVGKKRDGQRNDEREATLNQLLTEMDGFEESSGVIVVAATNNIDILDSALLRAGRFDRRIFVELPTKFERKSILIKYLQKIPNSVDVATLANMTVGFNGASLAALVNEAALLSLRQNDFQVTMEHFHQVKDKVMFGKKRLQILSPKQKDYRITYQASKALCATYFDLPFEKLMLSNEKLTPSTNEPLLKSELESRIKMLLAGMAGCNLNYNEHSTNAKNDLNEAKKLVENMLKDYGMGSSLYPKDEDFDIVINRLYQEIRLLLESMPKVLKKIKLDLSERESVLKVDIKGYLDAVL